MDLGISLNPFEVVDSIFDISGNQGRADQQIASSEQQRLLDNQYRARQERLYEQELARERQRQDTYLQRLVLDAQAAGISPLAALGNPGQTPMSLAMPTGQGGRVSGNYKRVPIPNFKAVTNLSPFGAEDQYNSSRLKQNQADYWFWKSRQAEGSFNATYGDDPDPIGKYPNLYIKAIDNSEEARSWYEQGYFPANNPELNLELPESVGGYYFAKPRFGGKSEQERLPYWGP